MQPPPAWKNVRRHLRSKAAAFICKPMLIVLSSPVPVADEARWINALFDAGLEYFHLRKPGRDRAEIEALLRDIDPSYRNRIASHHHHALALDSGMKRLHFTEFMRQKVDHDDLQTLRAQELILSASIHSHDDYPTLSDHFEYTFISPVFDSLSKEGYTAQPGLLRLPATSRHVKRIALGGIEANTCPEVSAAGFDGIAVLGAIWQASDPVQSFKNIQHAWHTTAPLY